MLNWLFTFVSYFGDSLILYSVATLLIAVYLMLRGNPKSALIVLGTWVCLPATYVLQELIKLPRPVVAINATINQVVLYGFPSGHVLYYTVFWGFLVYLSYVLRTEHKFIRRLVRLVGYSLIVLVGASRVYLGVHYVRDIVAGYILGLLVLVTLITLDRKVCYPVPKNKK